MAPEASRVMSGFFFAKRGFEKAAQGFAVSFPAFKLGGSHGGTMRVLTWIRYQARGTSGHDYQLDVPAAGIRFGATRRLNSRAITAIRDDVSISGEKYRRQ